MSSARTAKSSEERLQQFDKAIEEYQKIGRNASQKREHRRDAFFKAAFALEHGLPATPTLAALEPRYEAAVHLYELAGSLGLSKAYRRAADIIHRTPMNTFPPFRINAATYLRHAQRLEDTERGQGQLHIEMEGRDDGGTRVGSISWYGPFLERLDEVLGVVFFQARHRYVMHKVMRVWGTARAGVGPIVPLVNDVPLQILPEGGKQNSHDRAANIKFKTIVEKLKNDMGERKVRCVQTQRDKWLAKLKRSLNEEKFDDLTEEDRTSAIKVVNRMEKSNALDQAAQVREMDLLGMVWLRMTEIPLDRRKNARESIFKQLASAHENLNVVCQKGRHARLVSALEIIDENVERILGSDELNSLFFDAASKARDSILAKLPPTLLKVYEDDVDGKSPLMLQMKEDVKKVLYDDFVVKREHMDKALFEKKIVEVLLNI